MFLMNHLSLFLLSLISITAAQNGQFKGPGKIKWVDCAQNVPLSTTPTGGSFNASIVDLAHLPPSLHCGQLEVPMDYTRPFCNDNKITLGLAVVRSPKSIGPLFFCPGGTDPGVVVAWETALNVSNTFSGLEDLDLIVIDIRGTYSSNQLQVDLSTVGILESPYPTTQSEYDDAKNQSAIAIQSWIDNSTPPGIIQYVGTREVVQDYDEVRKALGYEKINFLGDSYGSYRAAQYAATFADRVDRFVLDAVAPHGRSFYDQAQDNIAAENRIVLRADAYCQNDPSCPFHRHGKGSVVKALNQVITTAKQTPYCLPPCTNDTETNVYLTAFDIQTSSFGALANEPDFPAFFLAIEHALNGDASLFQSPPATPESILQAVVGMPLICNDDGFENTFEAFNESLTDGLKNDITGIGLSNTWQLQIACSAWPYPVPAQEPLELNQKMLLVTSDFDASAPTEWTTFTWAHTPNSVLVDRHGDDHVSIPLVDQPSTAITKAFLNTGKLPVAQKSPLVTVYTPGMVRGPIADPYSVPTGASAGDIDSGEIVEIPF